MTRGLMYSLRTERIEPDWENNFDTRQGQTVLRRDKVWWANKCYRVSLNEALITRTSIRREICGCKRRVRQMWAVIR